MAEFVLELYVAQTDVYEAASADAVQEGARRAELLFERIAEAIMQSRGEKR